jgi:hypothetical protein
LVGAVIGVTLGLWFGVNIGKHKPFYSNPFAPANIESILRDRSADIVEKSGKVLEKGAQSLEKKSEDLRNKL